MAEGFLQRWSQRKVAVRQGQTPQEPLPASTPAHPPDIAAPSAAQPQPQPQPQPLTLKDVQALDAQSDYAPFVARSVEPEVRHAALRKLFTDPHYNVMDGLDVYVDDYARADPMPAAWMKKMAALAYLQSDGEQVDTSAVVVPADAPATGTTEHETPQPVTQNDDSDLRLQSHHAAAGTQPGRSAE